MKYQCLVKSKYLSRCALIFLTCCTNEREKMGALSVGSVRTYSRRNVANPSAQPIAVDLGAIKREWDNRTAALSKKSQDGWARRVKIAKEMFESGEAPLQNSLINYFCKRVPSGNSSSDFHEFFRSEVIDALVTRGNDCDLIKVLAAHCPDCVYMYRIEYYIAFYGNDRLKSGFLVLCDAFDRSEDARNQATIGTIIRRSFLPEQVTGKSDVEFVHNARAWYALNRDVVTPNEEYSIAGPNNGEPLFVHKKKATCSLNSESMRWLAIT